MDKELNPRPLPTAELHPPTPVMTIPRTLSSDLPLQGVMASEACNSPPSHSMPRSVVHSTGYSESMASGGLDDGGGEGYLNKQTVPSYLSQLLQTRRLQWTDRLFTTSDYELITELHSTLKKIKRIINEPSYKTSQNDQSIVNLVLARLTTAIKETSSIETYAPALVDLLEACLVHRMYIIGSDNQLRDSPHCKIAVEVLSTLFTLYHNNKCVMTVAIPVAVKALSSANYAGHHELVRSTTSYLALATIHNKKQLAQHSIQIISSIINGNYPLVRIVPQIYPLNREPFHAHLSPLFRIIHYATTDISEKLSLLQFASMVATVRPDLLVAYLPEFDELLVGSTTCTAVLHVLLTMASSIWAAGIGPRLPALRKAAIHTLSENNLFSMSRVLGAVGRSNESSAPTAVQDLLFLCDKCNQHTLPVVLKEIEGVAEIFPNAIHASRNTIREMSQHQPSIFALYRKFLGREEDSEVVDEPAGIAPQQALGSTNFINSFESMNSAPSKKSLQALPVDPTHADEQASGGGKGEDQPHAKMTASSKGDKRVEELDQAMQTLAEIYRRRSNGSLGLLGSGGGPWSRSNLTIGGSNTNSRLHSSSSRYASPVVYNNPAAIQQLPSYAQSMITPPETSYQRNSLLLMGELPYSRPSSSANNTRSYTRPSYHEQQRRDKAHPEAPVFSGISNSAIASQLGKECHTSGPSISEMKSQRRESRLGMEEIPTQEISQMVQSYCGAVIPFQLGKDGRIRPVSAALHRTRHNLPQWIPSAASLPLYEGHPTTHFPVNASGSLVKTTTTPMSNRKSTSGSRNESKRSHLQHSNGSSSGIPKVCVDEHSAARSNSRAQSADTMASGGGGVMVTSFRRDEEAAERDDVVKQFVEHRRSKIKRYVAELTLRYPIPTRCVVEASGKNNSKSIVLIQFVCQLNGPHCVYADYNNLFSLKTKIPSVWLHLMFLQQEAVNLNENGHVLTQGSEEFRQLDQCWSCLPNQIRHNRPFVQVVTSAFPSIKEQAQMLKELQDARYFDSFGFSAPLSKWICFSCAQPEKAKSLLRSNDSNAPLLEGQLKEKRSKWNPFRRWQTKYFTLSGAALTSCDGYRNHHASDRVAQREAFIGRSPMQKEAKNGGGGDYAYSSMHQSLLTSRNPTIELSKIRLVKSLKGRRSGKRLPKAFEIFTDDNSYILKANDRNQAEQWFKSLQIAVSQAQREQGNERHTHT